MATRELQDSCSWRLYGRVGAWCALVLLVAAQGTAEAQFYSAAGGGGRYFDPGHLSSGGGLRDIGGFARVNTNPALQGNRPQPPLPIMSLGKVGGATSNASLLSRYRSGGMASVSAGMASVRYEASMMEPASLRTPELTSRTFDAFAGEVGRSRTAAWEDRGLSVIGRGFVGEDTSFAPTLGMVRENRPRPQVIQRPDWTGQMRTIGSSPWSLAGALGPRFYGGSASGAGRLRPANEAVYKAAEVAIRSDRERAVGEPLPPTQNVSLNEVISERLQRRQDFFVQRGWSQFRARRYADAYNSFMLADTIRPHTAEAKVGLIISAIATSQYIAASNALLSMVEHNPDLLQQAVDMRAKYGNMDDFTAHYQAFEDYMRASASRNMGALYAFLLWGRGDRSGAQINAARVAEGVPAGSPLVRFATLVREASAAPRGQG